MSAVRAVLGAVRRMWILTAVFFALVVATASFAWQTVALGAQIAAVTAAAAAKAVQHRKELANRSAQHRKEIAKVKARARLRRVVVAVPLVGIVAVGYFEHRDYMEWQQTNPDGDFDAYMTEVSEASAEVLDDFLEQLPESVRPEPDIVLGLVEDALAAARDQKNAT